jgi:hypothetical protein
MCVEGVGLVSRNPPLGSNLINVRCAAFCEGERLREVYSNGMNTTRLLRRTF